MKLTMHYVTGRVFDVDGELLIGPQKMYNGKFACMLMAEEGKPVPEDWRKPGMPDTIPENSVMWLDPRCVVIDRETLRVQYNGREVAAVLDQTAQSWLKDHPEWPDIKAIREYHMNRRYVELMASGRSMVSAMDEKDQQAGNPTGIRMRSMDDLLHMLETIMQALQGGIMGADWACVAEAQAMLEQLTVPSLDDNGFPVGGLFRSRHRQEPPAVPHHTE